MRHIQTHKIPMHDNTEVFVRVIHQKNAKGTPIVLCDGLGCAGFVWKYIIEHFEKNHPIIHWNYRGHGQSDIPVKLNSISMHTLARDLENVLNHLEIDTAIFFGHSMGVQVLLESYALMPERFIALGLLCGGYKYPLETWHAAFERGGRTTLLNFGMKHIFPKIASSFIHHSKMWQPVWERMMPSPLSYLTAVTFDEVNKKRVRKEDLLPYFEDLGKMQARVFAQMANSFSAHNAEHVLSKIEHPTLIVAGGRDTFSPPWLSLDMHELISESELLMIPDGTHVTPIEHPELINLRLQKFIQDRAQKKRRQTHATGASLRLLA